MRAGVWCSAAALLLLVAVTSALRTSQVVESTRNSRRLSSNSDARGPTSTVKIEDVQPTFRPRSPRRREEPLSSTPRDTVRTRSRSKAPDTYISTTVTELSQTENEPHERFDSRRTNRVRSRPTENERSVDIAYDSRAATSKSKVRQSRRRLQTTTTDATLRLSSPVIADSNFRDVNNRRTQSTSTPASLEQSSSIIDDSLTRDTNIRRSLSSSTKVPLGLSSPVAENNKIEVVSSNFDDFTRTVPKEEGIATGQFKGRSSTVRAIESSTLATPKVTRSRGRINTRTNIKLEDMASSGATNTLTISAKIPTGERASSDETRNSRKLRYRTRFAETDTNLTGEGITTSNEIVKVIQKKQTFGSQPEIRISSPAPAEKKIQRSTERSLLQSTTIKTMRVVRRPLSKGKDNFAPSMTVSNVKTSDEIDDSDNYPESFKALIQAKNASTQVSSPPSESLSVKATHKVVNSYTQSVQISNMSRDSNNTTRHRSKLNTTGNGTSEDNKITESTTDLTKSKSQEYRLRGTYSPKSRKFNTLNAAAVTKSTTTSPVADKPLYKFNRKFKTTTTLTPAFENSAKNIQLESSQPLQKTAVRPSHYSRKRFGKNAIRSTESTTTSDHIKNGFNASIVTDKVKLPRTSYYSRLRNNIKNDIISTTEALSSVKNETPVAEKKTENTADMPLIFTLSNKPSKNNIGKENRFESKGNFLIAVSSKESLENNTDNEIVTNAEESENMPLINFATTQKYHANYKDKRLLNDSIKKDYLVTAATPSIRNIQTRKHTRKIIKSKETIETTSADPSIKPRDRTVRKYSDTFSKTTEASTNGIISEPEKPKSRFSSKYRASYLDKPFYKPTVPTVTPTTVVGEEIQLGPDMNAISFTQTRSAISSADLRLSESLVKPSHIMNVEASNHSPSVTVSIFDALAEILTSTPRTPISSTTEVPQQFFTDSVVKQTLNGVSNNNNVNSVSDLSSQGTTISTYSINTPVKITDQTTPTVLNRLPVGESVSTSLKSDEVELPSTNNPPTTPSPTPTPTSLNSARRPFAIKVLYSDTERPTDNPTSSEPKTNRPSTDNPKTVYNTVSDLLLSNNKLVSSELTSMLTNNIKNIIQNLDEDSRSKLSVDMAKLLKTLMPRAVNKLPTFNDNDVPYTTPYSLEEIRDTENIDINNPPTENKNFLQNVLDSNVNITQDPADSSLSVVYTERPVDISGELQSVSNSTLPEFESQTTVADIEISTEIENTNTPRSLDLTTMLTTTIKSDMNVDSFDIATLSGSETGITTVNNVGIDTFSNPTTESTNKPLPVPLFTNSNINEYTSNDISNSSSLVTLFDSQLQDVDNINIEDPSQISRLQLWILSKKARVLKMIEKLIREHNDEIANVTLSELIDQPKNVSLSNRLTEIINTMSSTTESVEPNVDFTTPNIIFGPNFNSVIPTTQYELPLSLNADSTETLSSFRADVTVPPTTVSNDALSTAIPVPTELVSTTGADVSEVTASQATSAIADALHSTTANPADQTTAEESTATQDLLEYTITSTENEQTTTQINTETSTSLIDIEKTTETSYITESTLATTTQAGIETTTVTLVNETKSNDVITTTTQLNVITQSTIPKKDYVIFGILPNNTVVRKDPNDNVLETLTEASPYIIYGVLPNNTVIRKFPNGTRVPRIMQKIDVLPISPWSLRNPYSPIHNNPAIVRPQSNPIRVSTNIVTSTDTNNGMENRLTIDTVNNQQMMISSSARNLKDSSSLGITIATIKPSAEKSTASHVLSLRTTTMLPSIHEILLNSLSSATKEEMVISSMTSSTREPRILTLDIDPETKQIRTERPIDGKGNTVFKFIPIDEVTIPPQNTNVLKLASTKPPSKLNTETEVQIVTAMSVTEINAPIPQIQTRLENIDEPTTTIKAMAGTPNEYILDSITPTETKTDSTTSTISSVILGTTAEPVKIMPTEKDATTIQLPATIINTPEITTKESLKFAETSTINTDSVLNTGTTLTPTTNFGMPTDDVFSENVVTISPTQATEVKVPTLNNALSTADIQSDFNKTQEQSKLLQSLLAALSKTLNPALSQESNQIQLLQTLLLATGQKSPNTYTASSTTPSTTLPSLEDDLRQFKEDTKLLKALLQATGQNPTDLKISNLGNIKSVVAVPTTTVPTTTSTISTSTTLTTTPIPTTTTTIMKTTSSVAEEIKKIKEDTQLLQALLTATGQNAAGLNLPIITGITSNVRIASNPLTTSIESNPTTPVNVRPVYTTIPPMGMFTTQTIVPQTTSVLTTSQDPQRTVTEEIGISTTYSPIDRILSTTNSPPVSLPTLSARRAPGKTQITTEIPSTSTFSVQEDLEFLKNLKTVLNTNNNIDDPEAALANRVIALAVERSLTEIETDKETDSFRSGKSINTNSDNVIRTTTTKTTTTTKISTTTVKPTAAPTQKTPSIEDDIKQFEEDTKLLQALLKATGQDPSKFNIPTLPSVNKPRIISPTPTTTKPLGVKIAVKDNLKNVQDDAQLLQTLIKLKDAQETTTQKNKLAITGQSSDEALQKLIKQAKPTVMVSEATKSTISLSTEYGNSNDALLAALLKEQGFGPTTASSLDEQVRLAALLNQVVVTPKVRRTTTPPPPPPPPRRPILDGLAWLWQQWRDTAPGASNEAPRTNNKRQPSSSRPSASASAAVPSRVNWFGSGPFVGNADDRPSSNRIPLEPPRAVVAEQAPGRGQLVSAAINVTRAFSQFLGAAIQGAAQTVQNVIRAGQKAATDVYTNGSG